MRYAAGEQDSQAYGDGSSASHPPSADGGQGTPYAAGQTIPPGMRGTPITLVPIEHQSGDAEILFAGTFWGNTVITRHTRKEGGFVRDYVANPDFADWAMAQHWTTNIVIDGDGERATAFAHVKMVKPEDDGGRIILVGWYEDELVKTDGTWRFSRRKVRAGRP